MTAATAREVHSPSQKARLAHLLASGALPVDADTVEPLYACAGCGACTELCPFTGFELAPALREARAGGPHPAGVAAALDTLEATGSPFGLAPLPEDEIFESPDALYFAGCAERAFAPETAAAAVSLMRQAGWTVARVPSREVCCGHALRCLGSPGPVAPGLWDLVAVLSPSRVVVGCPECYRELAGAGLEVEVEPALRVVRRLHREGRLRLTPLGPGEVTYHDPCGWTRLTDLGRDPLELLEAVGLQVRLPRRHGRQTDCCGAGDLLAVHSPTVARQVARRRLAALGGPTVVTSCARCRQALREAGAADVHDLLELVAGGGEDG